MEWLRGWLFTGFPWLQLGYSQSDTPLAALATRRRHPPRHLRSRGDRGRDHRGLLPGRRPGASPRSRSPRHCGSAAGCSTAANGRGRRANPIDIALLQGAIPQDEKWLVENRANDAREVPRAQPRGARREDHRLAGVGDPDARARRDVFLDGIRRESAARGSDVMLGLLNFDQETRRDPQRPLLDEQRRRRLVLQAPARAVRRVLPGAGSRAQLDAAAEPAVLRHDARRGAPGAAAGRAASGSPRRSATRTPTASDQLAALPASTLLVNVTNNAWFGDSSAPHQQLQMARFRALEAGRFLMRATSNGITAVIGPDGAVRRPHPPVRARHPQVDRPAAHRPHALRPHRQLADPHASHSSCLIAFAIARLRTRHNA